MAKRVHPIPKGVLGIVLVVLLGFIAVGVWNGTRQGATITAYYAARQWDEVPATIIRAEWKEEDTGEGMTYWVKAEYEYHYRGQRYTGRRVSLHGGSDNVGTFWQDVYRQLNTCRRTGRPFHCYVNPAEPTQALLYRNLRWEMLVFQSLLTVGFAGGGLGFLIALLFAIVATRRTESLAVAYPGEPWLWKADWVKGEITSSAKPQVVTAIVLAFVFNLFSVPVGLLLLNDLIHGHEWYALLAMIFPILGLAILGWAFLVVLRWRKYGQSVFKMAAVPGIIGGELAGVICTLAKIRPTDGFRLTLTCSETSNDTEHVVWQHEQVIVREVPGGDGQQSAVPVLFQIPFTCQPTDDAAKTSWTLAMRASVPGVDYIDTFEVPVFKTSQSAPDFVPSDSAIAQYAAPPDPARELRDAGVVKTASPLGDRYRFVFSLPRSFGITAFALGCWLVCSAMILLMLFMQAPPDVCIIPGLVDAMILSFLVKFAFRRTVVEVSDRGLAVTTGPFGWGRRRDVDASEIIGIESAQVTGQFRFELVLVCRDGVRLTLARWIPSDRLAAAVIREIESAMTDLGTVPPDTFALKMSAEETTTDGGGTNPPGLNDRTDQPQRYSRHWFNPGER